MENLILWGVPILGALAGLSCRLFKSYTTFLNLTFAVYISLWSESSISKLFRVPSSAEPYKAAITMLFCAILAWVLLQKLLDQLNPEERDFVFPLPLLDKLGGGLFGFLSGMAVVNFAAFLICIMPLKTNFTSLVSLPATEQTCCAKLLSFTRLIDGLSFQSKSRAQRAEALEERIRKADPPPPPEEEKKKEGEEDAEDVNDVKDATDAVSSVPADAAESPDSTAEGEPKSTEDGKSSETEAESGESGESTEDKTESESTEDESSETEAESGESGESTEDKTESAVDYESSEDEAEFGEDDE